MNPIRNILLSAAIAGISLYGGHQVMAEAAGAALADKAMATQTQPVAPGNPNVIQVAEYRGGGGGGGGVPHHSGGGGGGGVPHHSGGGMVMPRHSGGTMMMRHHNGGVVMPHRQNFTTGSIGPKHSYMSGKHRYDGRYRHHHRHWHNGVWVYDYGDYGYSDYDTCYWNCRNYAGPHYCRIYWQQYCD